MNVRHPMGVLHSFSIKKIFHDKIKVRLFYIDVVISKHSSEIGVSLVTKCLCFCKWDALRDWVPLNNLKNMKQFEKCENAHVGVLLLVKLQVEPCQYTKSNIPPRVFITFFKLYKRYQIARSITDILGIYIFFRDIS